jgi:hypothetical protein
MTNATNSSKQADQSPCADLKKALTKIALHRYVSKDRMWWFNLLTGFSLNEGGAPNLYVVWGGAIRGFYVYFGFSKRFRHYCFWNYGEFKKRRYSFGEYWTSKEYNP